MNRLTSYSAAVAWILYHRANLRTGIYAWPREALYLRLGVRDRAAHLVWVDKRAELIRYVYPRLTQTKRAYRARTRRRRRRR